MNKSTIIGYITITLIGIIMLFVFPPIGIAILGFLVFCFVINSSNKNRPTSLIGSIFDWIFRIVAPILLIILAVAGGILLLFSFPPAGILWFFILYKLFKFLRK